MLNKLWLNKQIPVSVQLYLQQQNVLTILPVVLQTAPPSGHGRGTVHQSLLQLHLNRPADPPHLEPHRTVPSPAGLSGSRPSTQGVPVPRPLLVRTPSHWIEAHPKDLDSVPLPTRRPHDSTTLRSDDPTTLPLHKVVPGGTRVRTQTGEFAGGTTQARSRRRHKTLGGQARRGP